MADTVAKTTDEQKVKINEKKWSKPLWSAGWSGIPNIIIERQEALGLDPIDMNIILHLTQYWWRADNPPSPSVGTIAKALKLGVRTIQKHIKRLEDAKLIERVERRDGPYGSQTNLYGGLLWSRALPDSRIEIGLERSVSYDDDDDETVVDTAFSVAWSQDVNALSSIGLDLSYEISDAPSERVEETGIGATWRYSLTPDWRLDTGVRYRVRDDLDGRAESPSAFVAVSRSFDFRP